MSDYLVGIAKAERKGFLLGLDSALLQVDLARKIMRDRLSLVYNEPLDLVESLINEVKDKNNFNQQEKENEIKT